jgi:hypothetical protein
MAKMFFYVCGGVCLLVLAFGFGTTIGRAQSGMVLDLASVTTGPTVVAASGRTLYLAGVDASVTPPHLNSPGVLPEVPGAGSVVGVGGTGRSDVLYIVVLSDGSVYGFTQSGAWTLLGNMAGGAVPAVRSSWGALKATYRK